MARTKRADEDPREPIDDEETIEHEPADESDEDLRAVLDQLGPAGTLKLSVWQLAPKRGFVDEIAGDDFDLAEFARAHGRGTYEIRVYVAGQPGLKARRRLEIAGHHAPAAAIAAAPRDDSRELLVSMLTSQTQLITALISRPAPTIDPAVLALLTQRSSASDLAELVRVTRDLGATGGETNWADVVKAGLNFASAMGMQPTGGTPPHHPARVALPGPPNAPNLRQPAISHYRPAGTGANGPIPTPTPTPSNDGAPAPNQKSPSETPEFPPSGGSAAIALLLGIFKGYATDPRPRPIVYASAIIQALGEELLTTAVNTTQEGELADQLVGMVGEVVPRPFLELVEDELRAEFEQEEKEAVAA